MAVAIAVEDEVVVAEVAEEAVEVALEALIKRSEVGALLPLLERKRPLIKKFITPRSMHQWHHQEKDRVYICQETLLQSTKNNRYSLPFNPLSIFPLSKLRVVSTQI